MSSLKTSSFVKAMKNVRTAWVTQRCFVRSVDTSTAASVLNWGIRKGRIIHSVQDAKTSSGLYIDRHYFTPFPSLPKKTRSHDDSITCLIWTLHSVCACFCKWIITETIHLYPTSIPTHITLIEYQITTLVSVCTLYLTSLTVSALRSLYYYKIPIVL